MIKTILDKIESKRSSKNIFWISSVRTKDFFYYLFYGFKKDKKRLDFLKNIYASLSFKITYLIMFSRIINNKNYVELKKIKRIIETLYQNNKAGTEKIDLMDTTFIIPVKYDFSDRKNNLDYIIKYLKLFFNTNIIVAECDKEKSFEYLSKNVRYVFFKNSNEAFHRTKIINDAVKLSNTQFVSIYDADIMADPLDIYFSVKLLREKKADFAYPFNGGFVYLSEPTTGSIHKKNISKHKNGKKADFLFHVGGVFFADKNKYIEAGMENQNFISWGREDNERYHRFKKLGYKIRRTGSFVLHLYHRRDLNGRPENPYFLNNKKEIRKIKKMSREQLLAYIKTWPWLKNVR